MLYIYKCGHTKSIDGGIWGTEILNHNCDECKNNKRTPSYTSALKGLDKTQNDKRMKK